MSEHGGSIVNIASIGGLAVDPGLGVYNSTKAALHATRHMACDPAPWVMINPAAPGTVKTKFSEVLWRDEEEAVVRITPAGRLGEPEDVAQATVFLLSERASRVTGETFVVDGGQLLHSELSSLPGGTS
jgi:NAD(P)-dependent dehydrogenase (short-subunit alcohol dehydrogenase family)